MIYILVDGSYYCFYRFYALCTWWKNAHPEEELGDPFLNPHFVEKFRNTFVSKLQELTKQIKRTLPKGTEVTMYVGKDCPRKTIWRMEHYGEYKANREKDDAFLGGPFFAMAYGEQLFQKGGCELVLKCPTLEADDCIAIMTQHLISKEDTEGVWIIASDADYLQLAHPKLSIVDLKLKPINRSKKWSGNPETDLMCKMIMGDPSDGIPAIFPKCGIKTAQRCIDEPAFLEKQFNKHPDAKDKLAKNKTLIDFQCIPPDLVATFTNRFL